MGSAIEMLFLLRSLRDWSVKVGMLIEEAKRRQSELKKILYEMASECMSEERLREMIIKFKPLYTNKFRHNYSEFFPMIVEISKDDNEYDLDFLSNNLEAMRIMVENDYVAGEKEFEGLYRPLMKLSDHINLEIGRYNHYSVNEKKVSDLEKRNQSLQVELRRATMELENAKDRVSAVQTELIAVLSIFAAIVLAFSGSISFIGNALSGMSNTYFFKAVFFVLLCGFVVFNLVFLMMYIVGKITGRNIYARCESENCTCGINNAPKCKGINRVRKRLPYVFWLNAALVVLMIADIVCWCLNMNFWHFPIY